ncbi:MAG: SPFH domain-containing protein [Phycisphaerales bacterium]|nr:SPFH domain-containing protein [Phycisphaerales bacterium]
MGWFSKPKSDRWEREPNDLAIRIEAEDVATVWGNKPYVVYEGTEAIIFECGVLQGRLEAGEHDVDGPLRKFLRGKDPTALILTDAGDVSMDFEIENLASAEHIELEMGVRLVVRLDQPEAFYQNVMKDRRRYLLDDFKSHLHPEILDALLAFTGIHPIEDLYGNPALRGETQRQLQSRLAVSLERFGFHVVAVSVTTVKSERYDEVRGRRVDAEIKNSLETVDRDRDRRSRETLVDRYENEADFQEAKIDVLRRVREKVAEKRSHEVDLRERINQATHELGLKDTLRGDELARLEASLESDALAFEQTSEQRREKSASDHEQALDESQREHERVEEAADLVAFLEARIETAKADEQARDVGRDGDAKDWELAKKIREDTLDARRRKKMQDVELERERMKTVAEADTATKIALGLGDSEALLELERLEKQKGMSPDQLLAMAAETSPAVAAALAERWKVEGRNSEEIADLLRRQLEQERQRNDKHSAQMERVLKASLEANAAVNVAKAESDGPGNPTIITGGLGSPTVVNPRRPKSSGEGDGETAD